MSASSVYLGISCEDRHFVWYCRVLGKWKGKRKDNLRPPANYRAVSIYRAYTNREIRQRILKGKESFAKVPSVTFSRTTTGLAKSIKVQVNS